MTINDTKPLVSVVMSIYNEPEDYLRESIESILNQTFSDFEFIIVIDNPEYKQAYQIINSYAADDRRIRIISNEVNEGLASSLNKGFFVAKGRYIARMDADDISFPQRLKKQFGFMEERPDLTLIGSSMVYIDETKKIIESKFARSNYKFLEKYILYGGTPCFHPTWFFKRDLLKRIKGYRLLPTSQDYDFLTRMFYLGIKVSNMEEPLLYHRIHFARISAEKNIDQLKLTRYIMKAMQEGFIMDDEKFSPGIVSDILKTPLPLYLLHKLSLSLYILASKLRNDNKGVGGFLFYIMSMLISPYRMRHAFLNVVRSLVLINRELRERQNEGGR